MIPRIKPLINCVGKTHQPTELTVNFAHLVKQPLMSLPYFLVNRSKDKSDYKLKDGVHCMPCPVSPFWAPRGGALEALNDFPKLRKHGVRASSAFTSSH